MLKLILTVVGASIGLVFSPVSVSSQTGTPPSAVEQANALRDRGDIAAAARLLESHVASYPGDGNAARLLAQTRYWLKDIAGATALYDAALSRHPHDTATRLDYAQMLMETRRDSRAITILSPLRNAPAVEARVASMLGTIAYWRGDLSGASRQFQVALRANPGDANARRQLDEIRSLSAPWLGFTSTGHTDDQPLGAYSVGGEAGWFAAPLTSLSARVDQLQFEPGSDAVIGSALTITQAEGRLSHHAAGLRTDISLAGGAIRRSAGSPSSDWTGRGALRLHLARHLFAEARAERAPYLHTLASLTTPVMTNLAAATFGLDDPRGWLGETALRLQSFPDDNTVRSAHAWLLAPVIRSQKAQLQIGYAFARQDSDSSRYVLARPVQLVPPGDPAFSIAGVYAPYYTPDDLQSHSALAGITLRPSAASTIRVNGSYAFSASQDVPYFERLGSIPVGGVTIRRATVRQNFSPWTARASIEQRVSERASLGAHAEHSKTAFYSATTAGLRVTYRPIAARSRSEGL